MIYIRLFGSTLFDGQSTLFIENTVIDNISTYYKPIFQNFYNEITFKNIDINNINIFCDINECNLMSVNMSENIHFYNVKIHNVYSSSNIIQFNGDNINIEFYNITLENLNSDGAFLKCNSENVKKKNNYNIFL